MKKVRQHIKNKAKGAKAIVHQALRSRPQPPTSNEEDGRQQGAEIHGSASTPGPLDTEAQHGAPAHVPEEPYLPSEPIEDAARAMGSMHILKSSRMAAANDAVQSMQDSDIVDVFSPLVEHLTIFSGLIDTISEIHPYAKMALFIFQGITTVVIGQIKRDGALQDLLSTISDIYDLVNKHRRIEGLDKTRKGLLCKLSMQTVECAYFIRDQAKIENFFERAIKSTLRGPSVDDRIELYKAVFDTIRHRLMEGGVLTTEIHVFRGLLEISEEIELLSLTHVRGAGHNSAKACLLGTRTEILDDLSAWVNGPSSSQLRFLFGNAGRGKSAVAHSLAIRFNTLHRLGCFFAFDKNFQGDRHPESVLPTIAHELAGWNFDFKHALARILHDQPSLAHTTDIAAQWEKLIVQPAKQVTFVGQVLVIVDAFDESSQLQLQDLSRQLLLEQLTEGAEALPNSFRILITSRPEADILAQRGHFVDSSAVDSIDLDKITTGVAEDMEKYIRHTIRKREFSREELNEDQVKQLADKSEGLFQWATTACIEITRDPAGTSLSQRFASRLGPIIRGESSPKFPLDPLYSGILQQIFSSADEQAMGNFRSVMSQIICAAEPLSSKTLRNFRLFAEADSEVSISHVVGSMGALLSGVGDEKTPIRPLHTSFRDFLANGARSGPWHVDAQKGHLVMLLGSTAILKDKVKFNICKIETSYRRNDDIPGLRDRVTCPALAYAARYLKDHIHASSLLEDSYMTEFLLALQDLFCKKLLQWLEFLSVLGCVNTAPLILEHVAFLFPGVSHVDTCAALLDAAYFVRRFEQPISESAPHIYLSALSFAPESSITRQNFISQFPSLRIPRVTTSSRFPSALMHDNTVCATTWSHNGRHIAICSAMGRIGIWSTDTGRLAVFIPVKHDDAVYNIQFSPDDRRIVSGSSDGTVRIWDAATGKAVCDPVDNHSGPVMAVVYSPDGQLIASGSDDSTVHIRSADAGSTVGVLDRHCPEARITTLAFSTDGHRLVVGADDHTVCVWDFARSKLVGEPLRGHSGPVQSISCSPDGRHIVSGSDDHTLRIWDIRDGTGVGEPLCGHSGQVWAVAHSLDGHRIISGSSDRTIRVWDAESGAAIGIALRGHSVWKMAYSPDGHRIAFLSVSDSKVHVCDADMLEADDNPSDSLRSSPVYAVAYSPDGRRIASCSDDGKIRVYDTASGELIGEPFVGHTDAPVSISYSLDGRYIVSGGVNGMVCIWTAETGELTVVAHTADADRIVRCVAYSPDGQHIIWGGNAGISVYNAEAHKVVESISCSDSSGDPDTIWTIACSPDGQRFVSGSEDAAFQIWDAHTRKPIGKPLEGHSERIRAVAFSPDGYRIVSASDDCDIRIWNVDTLKPIRGPLRGHTQSVMSVAYSLDGRRIVSGSADLSVRLWDAETGEVIGAPLYGHSSIVRSVAWSPDGQFIVSGSQDAAIRIWKAVSGSL